MFGYASSDTPELMRAASDQQAGASARPGRLVGGAQVRRGCRYLRPDGKTLRHHRVRRATRSHPARHRSWCPASTPRRSTWTARLLAVDIARASSWRLEVAPLRHRRLRLPAAGQPHRPVRHRRSDGRRRTDRSEDHRRYLRRDVARHGGGGLLRQGSVEGRPDRRVCDALGGQERRLPGLAERVEAQVAYAIGVAAPGRTFRGDLRHRGGRPDEDRRTRSREVFEPPACRDDPGPRPASARSTRRPPPTGTSAARTSSSPGRTWTGSTPSSPTSASDPLLPRRGSSAGMKLSRPTPSPNGQSLRAPGA